MMILTSVSPMITSLIFCFCFYSLFDQGPTPNGTLLPPSSIPPSFWSQLYKASEKFKDYQMSTIEENMNLYENQDFYAMEEIKEIQRCCAERFYQTCQPIPTAEWICPGKSMKMSKNMSRQKLQGTWHERQSDKKMTHQEVVHRMEDQYRSTEQNGGLTQVAMKVLYFSFSCFLFFSNLLKKKLKKVFFFLYVCVYFLFTFFYDIFMFLLIFFYFVQEQTIKIFARM